MTRPRDSQQSKLYRAEVAAFGESREEFGSVGEMQAYIDQTLRTRWFRNRWRTKRVTVTDGRMRRRGGASYSYAGWDPGWQLKMPRRTRCEWYLLHELAHVVTPGHCASHGREYARNYLALVRRFMGEDAHVKLRDSFRKHKVKWHPKRSPQPGRVPPWLKKEVAA